MLSRKAALAATAFGVVLGSAALGTGAAQAQVDNNRLIPCAPENGVCKVPYPTNVFYGAQGRTVGKPLPQGGAIACNNQTFGRDPVPGVPKSCSYAAAQGSEPGVRGRVGGEDEYRRREPRRDYGGDYGRDPRREYGRDYDRPRREPDGYGRGEYGRGGYGGRPRRGYEDDDE